MVRPCLSLHIKGYLYCLLLDAMCKVINARRVCTRVLARFVIGSYVCVHSCILFVFTLIRRTSVFDLRIYLQAVLTQGLISSYCSIYLCSLYAMYSFSINKILFFDQRITKNVYQYNDFKGLAGSLPKSIYNLASNFMF